jgi:hypothetical protein
LHTTDYRDTVSCMTIVVAIPAAQKRIASLHFATTTLLTLAFATLACSAAESAPSASKIEFGFEERVRTENSDNSTDFDRNAAKDDASHQWRFRTRAWARLSAGANTELMFSLNNESRKKTTPRVALTMDETVIDNFYLDRRFADGASIRIGRQNLSKGDGFIVADGGPGDGSRTAYFNAIDLGWTSGKSRLDLLIISDPHRDEYLPRIHDQTRTLIDWDENALGLYWTDASRAQTTLEAYYFYKSETGDTCALTNPKRQGDRMFHTLGARVARDLPRNWSVKAELAAQAGVQRPDRDVLAWGAQASVKKAFACGTKPSILLGWTGLSGDNPATTTRNEGWDPLFSRYPKWSELYIYSLGSERGSSYWTNLSMGQAEVRLMPAQPLELRATYYRMAAFHAMGAFAPFPAKPKLFGGGTLRGDLFAARADYKLNDNWRGHVVGEYLAPGDFYAGSDYGWFLRAEVLCSFKQSFAR